MLLKYVFKDHSCISTIAAQIPMEENALYEILLSSGSNIFFAFFS